MIKIKKIKFEVEGTLIEGDSWNIETVASITLSPEGHPDFENKRGIPVKLTPAQELQLKNFIKDVIFPQGQKSLARR